MKVKTILLTFGLLFVIGTVMLVVNTWADGPAGPVPIGMEEVYEVAMPVDLPGELSTDEVKMLAMLGVLVPKGAEQLATAEGSKCHWEVYWCGGDNSYCKECQWGPGPSPCSCPRSPADNPR